MRLFLATIFVLLFSIGGHAYLKIDTNQLILKPSVTNINIVPVSEPLVPSSYLKTGKIEFIEPETSLRRFDIIYFIAIPITFYLTINLVFMINNSFMAQDPGIPNGVFPSTTAAPTQFRWVLLNTLLIPFFVAWEDYRYMKQHAPETADPPNMNAGVDLGINLVSLSF